MKNVRHNLIQKIEKDTGFRIQNDWKFERPTLNWAHKSAGRMIWYYYTDKGFIVGSCEKMTDLLKSDKIIIYKGHFGFVEFSSN
jgi:hypothetical protein